MRRRAVVLLLVLATGCSLPLPSGVKTAGTAPGGVAEPADVTALPPDPKPNQSPGDVVAGFLGAQANLDGKHRIARRYLTAAEASDWDDTEEIRVYGPETLDIRVPEVSSGATQVVVKVRSQVSGEVDRRGAYVTQALGVEEEYVLTRPAATADWRLSSVPPGLRLTRADLLRGFAPYDVFYLAPHTATNDRPHVVPDRVFLQQGAELAKALVARMLLPPSEGLYGAVTSGLPPGVTLGVTTVTQPLDGIVTVDLSGPASTFSPQQRQELAARLVWTLGNIGPSFRRLRLLSEGGPLAVAGAESGLLDVRAFDGYDPEGLGVDPPYFFVNKRRLGAAPSLTLTSLPLLAGDAGDAGFIGVDEVAVTPDRTQVAVLEHGPGSPARRAVTTHIGPLLRGSLADYPALPARTALTSPSWGSGAYGVWVIEQGSRVLRGFSAWHSVRFDNQPKGRLSSFVLSRDGTRAAMVIGDQVYVALVEVGAGEPRITHPTLLPSSPTLSRAVASQVVWRSSTDLLVLEKVSSSAQVVQVPVDGSSITVVQTGALIPQRIAAAGDAIVISSDGALFTARNVQLRPSGTFPVFPG
jgi:hypothetical protein